jgi:predicted PurR-regulated permease PerM
MSTTVGMESHSNEIATESIKDVADVFNRGINGNPLAFLSALVVIILAIILFGVLASNIYFQYQGMEKQMQSTLQMQKNNELLSQILKENEDTNKLIQKYFDLENYRRSK